VPGSAGRPGRHPTRRRRSRSRLAPRTAHDPRVAVVVAVGDGGIHLRADECDEALQQPSVKASGADLVPDPEAANRPDTRAALPGRPREAGVEADAKVATEPPMLPGDPSSWETDTSQQHSRSSSRSTRRLEEADPAEVAWKAKTDPLSWSTTDASPWPMTPVPPARRSVGQTSDRRRWSGARRGRRARAGRPGRTGHRRRRGRSRRE
jgi:hypothetical protein